MVDKVAVFTPPDADEMQLAAIVGALNRITEGEACEADWEALKPCYFCHGAQYRPSEDATLLTVWNGRR